MLRRPLAVCWLLTLDFSLLLLSRLPFVCERMHASKNTSVGVRKKHSNKQPQGESPLQARPQEVQRLPLA